MTASLPTLMTQFRARYPMGSLLSEFQTVHDGLFVVRAIAQIGATPLSSGLAAEPTIEQAEDRAKVRAIEALGIQSFMPTIAPTALSEASLSAPLPDSAAAAIDLFAIAQPEPSKLSDLSDLSQLNESSPTPLPSPLAATSHPPTVEPDLTLPNASSDSLSNGPEFRPPAKEVRRKPTSEVAPAADSVAPAVAPSMDLSDVIAQTSVELKRLGWTEPQGRKHLQQTYSKRSRQQLTDDELLDFLNYLQAQPSPTEADQ